MRREEEGDLWLFGYGSIAWRPAFPWTERKAASVRGWARRFWQGSTDHRGRPGAPGRVVTLVPVPRAVCWGVAYRVEARRIPEVLDGLDEREKGGFERCAVTISFCAAGPEREAITYRAAPGNPNYLGPAPLPAIAAQIRRSVGPSGPNAEYLLRLAETLRGIGADDPHVFALEALVRLESGPRGAEDSPE